MRVIKRLIAIQLIGGCQIPLFVYMINFLRVIYITLPPLKIKSSLKKLPFKYRQVKPQNVKSADIRISQKIQSLLRYVFKFRGIFNVFVFNIYNPADINRYRHAGIDAFYKTAPCAVRHQLNHAYLDDLIFFN